MVRGSRYRRQVALQPRRGISGFILVALVLTALIALLWLLRPLLYEGLQGGLLGARDVGRSALGQSVGDIAPRQDELSASTAERQTIVRWVDAGGGDVLVVNAASEDAIVNATGGGAGECVVEDIVLGEGAGVGVSADAGEGGGTGDAGGTAGGVVPDGESALAIPPSGWVFESVDKGLAANLKVVVPEGSKDAYVKLRDPQSGEMLLSFYVRSGTAVEACVPAKLCEFAYSLGERDEWEGPVRDFGAAAIYAKSDIALDFRKPGNFYTYTFNTEDGNVNPVPITKEEFSGEGGSLMEGGSLITA